MEVQGVTGVRAQTQYLREREREREGEREKLSQFRWDSFVPEDFSSGLLVHKFPTQISRKLFVVAPGDDGTVQPLIEVDMQISRKHFWDLDRVNSVKLPVMEEGAASFDIEKERVSRVDRTAARAEERYRGGRVGLAVALPFQCA